LPLPFHAPHWERKKIYPDGVGEKRGEGGEIIFTDKKLEV
jgi:hypothetical protein